MQISEMKQKQIIDVVQPLSIFLTVSEFLYFGYFSWSCFAIISSLCDFAVKFLV